MRTPTVITALLAGVSLAATAFAQPAGAPTCPHLFVSSQQEGGKDRPGTRFSATKTVDLTFAVLFPQGVPGEHTLKLQVYLPSSDLYQTIDVPIAASGTTPAAATRGAKLRGYRHPVPKTVPVRQTIAGQGFNRVEVPFPVAGTAIVSSSLYGVWRVEAFMDGSAAPCGPASRFTLVQ